MTKPIDLYFWPTPNGWKISIALAEMGLPYNLHLINIGAGDQFKPKFLEISPNNKMPAIVDHDGPDNAPVSIFESGAILQYLARKTGQFYGVTERDRISVDQWLMWQMGGLGPMLGQTHHFIKYNKGKSEYAEKRYAAEAQRLYTVLNTRLDGRDFIAGQGRGTYSIADIACWPWVSRFEWQEVDLNAFPNIKEWYLRIAERPAVHAGYSVPKFTTNVPMP